MYSSEQRLRNLCTTAVVTGPADNSTQFPVQQIFHKEVVSEMTMLSPYGMYANVSNDALALTWSVDSDEAYKVGMAYTPQERPTDLEQDELALYHPKTGSFIKFRNSGKIEITSTENLDLVVSGAVNITVSGDANINADNVNIDASVTNLGVGGQPIARVGDSVECVVGSGSSAGTWPGTITSGGSNTSI